MKIGPRVVDEARRDVVLGGLALALAGRGTAAEGPPDPPVIRWPALVLLDGSILAPEEWRDVAAVVVFWETWCPYCRRHNARIERLYRTAAGPHLRILSVALDGDEATVGRYMATNDLHFPVVVGRSDLRAQFTSRRVIPMTCLVDRRGRMVQAIPGEMAEDDVLALAALASLAAAA